jgi:hypothetical protein
MLLLYCTLDLSPLSVPCTGHDCHAAEMRYARAACCTRQDVGTHVAGGEVRIT